MRLRFCKNSVFSILFLVLFLLGTICGIFLFRAMYVLHAGWITEYGTALMEPSSHGALSCLFALLLPFLLLFLFGILPEGHRLILLLVAVRGCLLCYCLCCCQISGAGFYSVLIRNLFLLPLFFLFSRYVWARCPFHREEIL